MIKGLGRDVRVVRARDAMNRICFNIFQHPLDSKRATKDIGMGFELYTESNSFLAVGKFTPEQFNIVSRAEPSLHIRQLFRVAARTCRVAIVLGAIPGALFPPSSMNLSEVQQSQSTQAANSACFLCRTFGEKALNWKMLLLSCCFFFIFWLSGQAYFFCSKGF